MSVISALDHVSKMGGGNAVYCAINPGNHRVEGGCCGAVLGGGRGFLGSVDGVFWRGVLRFWDGVVGLGEIGNGGVCCWVVVDAGAARGVWGACGGDDGVDGRRHPIDFSGGRGGCCEHLFCCDCFDAAIEVLMRVARSVEVLEDAIEMQCACMGPVDLENEVLPVRVKEEVGVCCACSECEFDVDEQPQMGRVDGWVGVVVHEGQCGDFSEPSCHKHVGCVGSICFTYDEHAR